MAKKKAPLKKVTVVPKGPEETINTELLTREEVVRPVDESSHAPGHQPEECPGCGQPVNFLEVLYCPTCGKSNNQTRNIWSWVKRFDMYVLLRQRFGNVAGWYDATDEERTKAVADILEMLKGRGLDTTDEAIGVQMRWVVRLKGKKPTTGVGPRQTITFIHNRSAAHAAGFIDDEKQEFTISFKEK